MLSAAKQLKVSKAPQDFQEPKSATAAIFSKLKINDGEAATKLIKKNQRYEFKSVLDLGCGEGAMLPYIQALGQGMTIHLSDIEKKRVEQYADQIQYNGSDHVGGKVVGKMEECVLPKTDLIMASHSLYYNTKFWHQPEHPFLTQLLAALNTNGLLCVILQSNEDTGILSNNPKRKFTANLQELEDLTYALKEKVADCSQRSFANAEMLLEALESYKKTHQNIDFESSDLSITSITISDLNFEPGLDGRYTQSQEVADYLNFYTRDLYQQTPSSKQEKYYSPEQQKELLDFIKENCQKEDGSYVITHVNKVIVVKHVAEQCKQENILATL